MKKRKMIVYRKRCKECGKEMLVENGKEEKCWECKEEFRRKWRRSSSFGDPERSEH